MTSPALMSKNSFFQTTLNNSNLSPETIMLFSNSAFSLMGDESCSEVSSSSPLNSYGTPTSPPALISLGSDMVSTAFQCSTDEVDLNFWGLDINTSPTPLYAAPTSSTSSGISPKSLSFLSDEGNSPIGRDDLSPASSIISSGFGADPVEKKKKGSNSRQTDELCLVCGDRASGYHYNALTCEGCKGFFRRSITKNAVYSCKYGQNCEMDMYMRRKCQLCRFKKCLNMGMKPECVVPENTCLQKREQKKAREKDKSIKSEPLTPLSGDALQSAEAFPLPPSLKVNCGKIELTKEHQELISRLIVYQDYYECPPEVNDFVPSKASDEEKSVQILEMTKLTTDLIIKFALTAPGFLSLPVPDQVTLLKTCNAELMTLRASRRYDPETDSIVFANNVPCTRDFYLSAGIKPATTVALFDFCRKMAAMKVDNAEYALLSGIALFSDRPQLKERKKAEIIQYLYVETLYAYVINKWSSKSGTMIAKLLNVLTQLRTLGNNNNEQCEYYHQKGKKIPEIMREMLDMQKR